MLVDRIRNKRVLVVGDVMVDFFVSGRVQRVSPEAPALILNITNKVGMIGGAGNVATNIISLGGYAFLCGVIGKDSAADIIDQEINANCPRFGDLLVRSGLRPTTTKTRFVAGDRHLLRADQEEIGLCPQEEAALIERIYSFGHQCDAIVVSDYVKGVICDTVMDAVRTLASSSGVPLIVDPKRRDISIYRGATVITPNESELASFYSKPLHTDADIEDAAQYCKSITNADVLLTRSERGVSLFETELPAWHDPAHARRVRDVSGAGDTVTAALALSLAAGIDMQSAARIANYASSIAVEQSGTTRVNARDLHLRLLRSEDEAVLADKLSTTESAREECDNWRRLGLRVGLTNGCFDLLHPGHVRLLQEARRKCDRLVVALNTDESVKRLKGDTRPIQSETARAIVISALEAVDLVIFFEEDTPLQLIRELKPNVLFKGADYNIEKVVGAEDVLAAGGEVCLIDLVSSQSTSRLIERSKALVVGKPMAVE